MTTLIIFLCIALLLVIIVQMARVRELARELRGSEAAVQRSTDTTGRGLLAFMVIFLLATTVSAVLYKNYMLGYGPHESASEHGSLIDGMMHVTLLVTYSVFIITHVFLFYYAYRYRQKKGRMARYISHNNLVEVVWTGIPAIVMTFLVVGGLDAWNVIMDDVGTSDEEYLEIEATGYQFAWQMRYPGPDGLLGRKDFRLISGTNPLGQDWTDPKNHDDIVVNDVTLPKGKKVRVRITAKDVLHDFYLPQFRVKMDAVPGLPTYFVFKPTKTTKEWRRDLSKYEEYQVEDPENKGKQLWETRNFELACAELCGIGHWSMKRTVNILEQDEYDAWAAQQTSFYLANIRGTEDDPLRDDLLPAEAEERRLAFNQEVTTALETPEDDDNTILLEYVTFETGSARLTPLSRYQLNDAAAFLKANDDVSAALLGHTDNTGNFDANLSLSRERANSVRAYLLEQGVSGNRLVSQGFGSTRPTETNATEEGRQANRRTELYITRGALPEPEEIGSEAANAL